MASAQALAERSTKKYGKCPQRSATSGRPFPPARVSELTRPQTDSPLQTPAERRSEQASNAPSKETRRAVTISPEARRLNALRAANILDSAPEPGFDTITRMACEHFQASAVALTFCDSSRVWVKSFWTQANSITRIVREVPRRGSLTEHVLLEDSHVEIPGLASSPEWDGKFRILRRLGVKSLLGVPIRSRDGLILGALCLYWDQPHLPTSEDDLQLLNNLADMAAGQVELRRLRQSGTLRKTHAPRTIVKSKTSWPRRSELLHALSERQFVLHYQPEIDLSTRRIVALEALIRWQHPELGLVPPMEFIPYAEQSGLILPIGDWVLEEACRQIQDWNHKHPESSSLRVCVNLSARQFSRPGLADHVQALMLQSGIDARQLGLEMTESSLIPNLSTAQEVLGELRKLGISLMMDDFGTGYSSLNHLHNFPFHVLKIDRSFVSRMSNGEQHLQIVRTIIELARVLGMDVVAEGIDSADHYRMLRQLGCRYGQGYLFSRPLNSEAMGKLLELPGMVLPDPEGAEASHG